MAEENNNTQQTEKEELLWEGVRITARKDGDSYTAFFSILYGTFEGYSVKPSTGHESLEKAMQAGKEFVTKHSWQPVETIGIFHLDVRKWWNGEWGYKVECGGAENKSGFTDRNAAIEAGKKRAAEKQAELDRDMR